MLTDELCLALATQAIAGASAVGEDPKYHDDFQTIREELQKIGVVSTTPVDWQKAYDAAVNLLQNKAKDVRVACYFGIVLLRTNGFAGFVQGLFILTKLVIQYWQDAFPQISSPQPRKQILLWWITTSSNFLPLYGQQEQQKIERSLMKSCEVYLAELRNFLEQQSDYNLSFLPIQDALKNLSAYLPEEVKPLQMVEQQVEQSKPIVPAINFQDVDQAAYKIFENLLELAEHAFEKDYSDGRSFIWRRFALWNQIIKLPTIKNGNQTALPAPELNLQNQLLLLLQKENWLGLLQFAEKNLSRYRFWLDLNYYAVEALQKLDVEGDVAILNINQATADLVLRLPTLTELQFDSGMPLANAETIIWLKKILNPEIENEEQLPQVDGSRFAIFDELTHLKGARLIKKLPQLQEIWLNLIDLKDQLDFALLLCGHFMEALPKELIQPYIEFLLLTLEKQQLIQWQRSLAILILETCYQYYFNKRLGNHVEKAENLLSQLSMLDVARAALLIKK